MTEIPDPTSSDAHQPTDENSREIPKKERVLYQRNVNYGRKSKSSTRWIAAATALAIAAGIYYVYFVLPAHRRHVNTVNTIVYAASLAPGQPSHLWLIGADGSGAHQLTYGAGSDSAPSFSSDGNQIAFLSNRDGGVNQVYLIDADGKNLFELTHKNAPKFKPRFSPVDPGHVLFISNGAVQVISVRNGSTDRLLPELEVHSTVSKSGDQAAGDASAAAATDYDLVASGTRDAPITALAAVERVSGHQILGVMPDINGPAIESRDVTVQGSKTSVPLFSADLLTLHAIPAAKGFVIGALGVPAGPEGQFVSAVVSTDTQGQVSNSPLFLAKSRDSGLINPTPSPDGSLFISEAIIHFGGPKQANVGLVAVAASAKNATRLVSGSASEAFFAPDGKSLYFLAPGKNGRNRLMHVAPSTGVVALVPDADVTSAEFSPQTK